MDTKRLMVMNMATGESQIAVSEAPTLSSASGPWQGVLLEQFSGGKPREYIDVATPGEVIITHIRSTTRLEWAEGGRFREVTIRPGQSAIIPSMTRFSVRNNQPGDIVCVSLDPAFMRCATHEQFEGPGNPTLRTVLGIDDPLLHALLLAMAAEVRAGFAGGRGYGESLATALAAHIVRLYSDAKPAATAQSRGLSRSQLSAAIGKIHNDFTGDVSLTTLASAAGLSPFHFARLFKLSTGLAPHQYVLRCRVEHARKLLLSRDTTTAEVAKAAGFCDQSHLTTHFRRLYGVTPRTFRQQARPGVAFAN